MASSFHHRETPALNYFAPSAEVQGVIVEPAAD
jgi:hypothetical protein